MAKKTKGQQQRTAPKYKKGNKPQQRQPSARTPASNPSVAVTLAPCPAGERNLAFHALDSWFFRESRPHDAAGASELSSIFPPPVRTLVGAIRTRIGDAIGIDWHAFNGGDGHAHQLQGLDLHRTIGHGDNLGTLQVKGPWVTLNGARYYPAPANLLKGKAQDDSNSSQTKQNNQDELQRLQIGPLERCDLGKVRLPQLPEGKVGYKNLDACWISAKGWEQILAGRVPALTELLAGKQLYGSEPRLGIALQHQQRVVEQGKLYQTNHLRLVPEASIELDVRGVPEPLQSTLEASGLQRLGGEGRMAHIGSSAQHHPYPKAPQPQADSYGLILYLATPADLDGSWLPTGFAKTTTEGTPEPQTIWQGSIHDVPLTIEAAVLGKVQREGGWDMQAHQPRAVRSLIPAGSAWYCTLNSDAITLEQAIRQLHGYHIGTQNEYGRGQLLIGLWNKKENELNHGNQS